MTKEEAFEKWCKQGTGAGWLDNEDLIRAAFSVAWDIQEKKVDEMKNILKDFLITKECRQTWIEEMRGTIEEVINE